MTRIKQLPPSELYRACDLSGLEFETTDDITETVTAATGQGRALESLAFGIDIRCEGYNVFALGPPGTGKFTAVSEILSEQAARLGTGSER